MNVDFYGYNLEHDENCFTPTTISRETAIRVPVQGKEVLDLGCGIGPLCIYFAKNGAKKVTATDIHEPHVIYTLKNSVNNNVNIDVVQGNLFENITETFDIICCDVSGVDRRVAEITGWFPEGVPTADETGADIICRAIEDSPSYLKDDGEMYICTTTFSDMDKILEKMNGEEELVYDVDIPFSKRLIANIDNLDPNSYKSKGHRYYWNFALWKMNR